MATAADLTIGGVWVDQVEGGKGSPRWDGTTPTTLRVDTSTLIYSLSITAGGVVENQTEVDAQSGGGYQQFLADTSNGTGIGINGTNVQAVDITDDPNYPGGTKGLRITYQGGGTAYSFGNQTVFIKHPEMTKFYMKTRVKFSADWEFGNDQLKYCKHKGSSSGVSTNFPKFNGSGIAYLTKLAPANPSLDDRAIYAVNPGADGDYAGSDDIVNDFGGVGVDANWTPTLGQWYDLEVEIDGGTPGSADGSYKMWVDGALYMQLDNVQVAQAGDLMFTSHELGHVWQNGSPTTDIDLEFSEIEIRTQRPV